MVPPTRDPAQAAPDHPQGDRGLRFALALQHFARGDHGTGQRPLRRRGANLRRRHAARCWRSWCCCSDRSRRTSPRRCGRNSASPGPVFKQPWPAYDPELAREELAEVVVQVNGKLRSRIHVPFGTSKEELERTARQDEKVQPSPRRQADREGHRRPRQAGQSGGEVRTNSSALLQPLRMVRRRTRCGPGVRSAGKPGVGLPGVSREDRSGRAPAPPPRRSPG